MKRERIDRMNKWSEELEFRVDGNKIRRVEKFKYLGRVVTQDNCDWMAVFGKPQKREIEVVQDKNSFE